MFAQDVKPEEVLLKKQNEISLKYKTLIREKIFSEGKNIKRAISRSFMKHIVKVKSIALFDERIFEIYQEIIHTYSMFLESTDNLNVKFNEKICKNLAGVTSVLQSRVELFYEGNNESDINPVYIEKKTIILKYIENVYVCIDKLYTNENYDNIENKDNFINNLLRLYENNLLKCFNKINDIEEREEFKVYNDMLEQEKGILYSIISVQLPEIEKLVDTENETKELTILSHILKNSYKKTISEFDDLFKKINLIQIGLNIDLMPDKENFKEIVQILFDDIINLKDEIQDEKNKLYNIYLEFKQKELIKSKENEIKAFKLGTKKSVDLSTKVREIFKNLAKYIDENKEDYEKNKNIDIINGIEESVKIKEETIFEKEKQIAEDSDFQNEIDELTNICDNNFDLDEINDINSLQNVLDYLYIKNDISNMDKKLSGYLKFVDEFIKNTILFEISTFQEIVYYSVGAIRECEEEALQELIKHIDEIDEKIEIILNDYNILFIKPNLRDKFNPKMHEILLAEENEEFERGDIIRIVNYGYITKDDTIIKRASIIACK